MRLDACPLEIVRAILQSLQPSDLVSACQVNKYLRKAAEPLLYAQVEWFWEPGRPPPVAQLISTLLHRPDLKTHVTRLAIDTDYFHGLDWMREPPPSIQYSEHLFAEFILHLKTTELPFLDIWASELRKGHIDALLALLLSQLPNIRSLHLGKSAARDCKLLGKILRLALCEQRSYGLPKFQRLHDVSFPPHH